MNIMRVCVGFFSGGEELGGVMGMMRRISTDGHQRG
jgi:hypothetical protein